MAKIHAMTAKGIAHRKSIPAHMYVRLLASLLDPEAYMYSESDEELMLTLCRVTLGGS